MVCVCQLLFKAVYIFLVLGYPGYKVYKLDKFRPDKIYLLYFIILGVFTLLEYTILFPLSWLLGKICYCMFPSLKAIFCLWLYYDTWRGALFLEDKFGKYIDMAFEKVNPIIGKYMEKIGVPNRDGGLGKKSV